MTARVGYFIHTVAILMLWAPCAWGQFSGIADEYINESEEIFTRAFENESITKSIRCEYRSQMTSNSLRIKLELESGDVSWKVINPEGKVDWEQSFDEAGQLDETKLLKNTPGNWTIELTVKNATGTVLMHWLGTNRNTLG